MRKPIVLLLFLVSFTAKSQLYVGPEFGFGMQQVDNVQIGRSFQPNWYGGAIFEWRINNWFGIKTGLNYAQKRQGYTEYDTTVIQIPGFDVDQLGFGDVDMNTYSEANGRISSHYLEIPAMARFSWKDYYIGVGGYAGYMLASRSRIYTESRTPLVNTVDLGALADLFGFGEFGAFIPPSYEETYVENKSKSDLKRFDFGLKGSLGYQAEHFGFNAMYQFGLTDYRKSGSGIGQNYHYLQLSVNYLFQLPTKKGASSL